MTGSEVQAYFSLPRRGCGATTPIPRHSLSQLNGWVSLGPGVDISIATSYLECKFDSAVFTIAFRRCGVRPNLNVLR